MLWLNCAAAQQISLMQHVTSSVVQLNETNGTFLFSTIVRQHTCAFNNLDKYGNVLFRWPYYKLKLLFILKPL